MAATLRDRLSSSSAVVLIGPRQIGRTTLARQIADAWPSGTVYLDLERPADLRRLDDADAFLRAENGRLIVLDEVHRQPGLFAVLRGVIDDNRRAGFRHGQFLMLGSASLDLLSMSSESLAGRVTHLQLSGINADEAADANIDPAQLWLRGGFPESLTAASDRLSAQWRADLVRTYLERDVPMFAPRLPAETLRRLWTMLAHSSGGLFNASRLAEALGASGPTVDRYVDLLVDLGLVRRLPSWHTNIGKRVVKSPKVFVRDTGLLHALLEIDTMHHLRGHPSVGASFESLAVECVIDAVATSYQPSHYRTARGDKLDLVLVKGGRPSIAIEAKLSTAPTVTPGFLRACADLAVRERYLVHPDADGGPYTGSGGTVVIGLTPLIQRLRALADAERA